MKMDANEFYTRAGMLIIESYEMSLAAVAAFDAKFQVSL